MNSILNDRRFRCLALSAALMLFVVPAFAHPAFVPAPDTIIVRGNGLTVEVIDGKVFVNGDEVKEGSELVFEGDDDVAWVDDDDVQVFVKKRMRAPDGNAFAFRVGPGEVRERVRKFIDDDVHVDREIVRERVPAPMMKHRMLFLGDEDEDFEIEEFAGAFADAEVWEMEREASRLAREARRAEGDEREKLEKELEKKLEAISSGRWSFGRSTSSGWKRCSKRPAPASKSGGKPGKKSSNAACASSSEKKTCMNGEPTGADEHPAEGKIFRNA